MVASAMQWDYSFEKLLNSWSGMGVWECVSSHDYIATILKSTVSKASIKAVGDSVCPIFDTQAYYQ